MGRLMGHNPSHRDAPWGNSLYVIQPMGCFPWDGRCTLKTAHETTLGTQLIPWDAHGNANVPWKQPMGPPMGRPMGELIGRNATHGLCPMRQFKSHGNGPWGTINAMRCPMGNLMGHNAAHGLCPVRQFTSLCPMGQFTSMVAAHGMSHGIHGMHMQATWDMLRPMDRLPRPMGATHGTTHGSHYARAGSCLSGEPPSPAIVYGHRATATAFIHVSVPARRRRRRFSSKEACLDSGVVVPAPL